MMKQRNNDEGRGQIMNQSSGSGKEEATGVAPMIHVRLFDDKVAPSAMQWDNVEDCIKILDRTDKEGTAMYAKMSQHVQDPKKTNPQGSRMLAELEDFVNVMGSLHSVFRISFYQNCNTVCLICVRHIVV